MEKLVVSQFHVRFTDVFYCFRAKVEKNFMTLANLNMKMLYTAAYSNTKIDKSNLVL